MEDTPKLYNTLITILKPSSEWKDQRHHQTMAWMIVGLLYSKTVNLSEWADFVVGRAQYAQSSVRRFSRWLNNKRIQVSVLYGPVIRAALAEWAGERIYVALDTSMLWAGYQVIRLAVIFRGGSVPLAWKSSDITAARWDLSITRTCWPERRSYCHQRARWFFWPIEALWTPI